MTDPHVEEIKPPNLDAIRAARERLGERIRQTPVWHWRGREIDALVGSDTQVFLKLELFQYAGTFKPRGALLNILALSDQARARGVTAFSAGNHAIATAFAARATGTSAKVVMPKAAAPFRIALCRTYGAEVVLVDDARQAFEEAGRIESNEGRTLIHPFEGPLTILGTATLGYEFGTRVENLDAVIVPIGGGGLCAGVASSIKQQQPPPHCAARCATSSRAIASASSCADPTWTQPPSRGRSFLIRRKAKRKLHHARSASPEHRVRRRSTAALHCRRVK